MARLNKNELLSKVISGFEEAGWNTLVQSSQHPFRLNVYSEDEIYRVRIYIWNITHGGRSRPANEYRIQVTGVEQFESEPNEKTLILGWWDEVGVFAGFDYYMHSDRLGSSPSLQIREENLRQAYLGGLSACLKENQEIAIAFRPELIIDYVQDLEVLHRFGESEIDLEILEKVSEDPNQANNEEIEMVSLERKVVVSNVQRKLRSSDFRRRVLTAYNHQCAFCGIQLNLVQAAHIIPVAHDVSSDITSNGVAACLLHHGAFDRGLITFNEEYRVLTNQFKFDELIKLRREEGAEEFINDLRPIIIVPPEIGQRPHIDFIRLANSIRGWG